MSTEPMTIPDAPAVQVPDVPYAIGIGGDELHAVDLDRIVVGRDGIVHVAEQLAGDGPLPQVGAECGTAVYIAWRRSPRLSSRRAPMFGCCPTRRCSCVSAA